MKLLKGWKTYLVGVAMVAVGIADICGVKNPDQAYTILMSLGVIAGRDAVGNISKGPQISFAPRLRKQVMTAVFRNSHPTKYVVSIV